MSGARKRMCVRKDKRLAISRGAKVGGSSAESARKTATFPTVLMTDANAPSLGLVGLVSLLFVFIACPVPFA